MRLTATTPYHRRAVLFQKPLKNIIHSTSLFMLKKKKAIFSPYLLQPLQHSDILKAPSEILSPLLKTLSKPIHYFRKKFQNHLYDI